MAQFLRFLVLVSCFCSISGAKNIDANPQTCDLGAKIKRFDSLGEISSDKAQEAFLMDLAKDPVFAVDEEKYALALKRLAKIPSAKNFVRERIIALSKLPNKKIHTSLFRERRATALASLLDLSDAIVNKPLRLAIMRNLAVELSETVASKNLKFEKLNFADFKARIEVLSDRNENDRVISEILDREADLRKNGQYSCRIQFLLGKAFRKARRYQDARNVLSQVAQNCNADDGRDAAFLLARLAAISPSIENMKYFEAFEKKYPGHSYLDDVLIFKASALESMNRIEEAKGVLREIASEISGDQKAEAIFRLAFLTAKEGQSLEASQILSASLESKDTYETEAQFQRAKYWSARLRLFPQVTSFVRAKPSDGDVKAKKDLEELASARGQTFYSWLSMQLLQTLDKRPPKRNVANSSTQLSDKEVGPVFETILCMFKKGHVQEATRLVESIEASEYSESERLKIAQRFSEIGLDAEAFRFIQGAVRESSDLAKDKEVISMLYPRAHEAEVANAAKQVKVPQNLLYGLMREESRFDARAVSWAGARGALQLMPSVAREEALRLKITKLSEEEMLNPKINVLLGAQHIKTMLEQLNHPLFAVAAYNAGIKSVKAWQEKFSAVKALDAFVESIPFPETCAYVKRVAGSWIVYSNLYTNDDGLFGIEINKAR